MRSRRTLQEQLWEILEDEQSTHPLAKVDDIVITIAILLSIVLVVLTSNAALIERYGTTLLRINLALDLFFLAEYLLRFFAAGWLREYRGWRRIRFATQPMPLLDLLSLLPLLQFVSPGLRILRLVRIIRILRAFKLIRYNKTLRRLIDTIRLALPSLLNMFFLVLIAILLLATVLWAFEHEAQPDQFGDILTALWPSAITLTTIGYGDTYPVTVLGKIFTVVFHIFGGSFLVGLPLVIVADAWSQAAAEEE